MKKQTFLLLSGFAALTLVGCDKEDSPQPPKTTVTPRVKAPQTVIPSALPIAPSSSTDAAIEDLSIQQTRKRILAEITQLIAKPDAGLSIEDWKTIKARYWKPDFDQVLQPAVEASNVRNLLAVPSGREPLISQILAGRFVDVSDKAEQEALLAFHTLALVTAASGGTSLPAALEDRKADANITRGDLILFTVFDDAFIDVPRRQHVSKAELDQWQQLAKSPNSLYRLLALRTYRRVASSPEQWLKFYHAFVDEQDQGILEEAASLTFLTAKTEAAALLREIRAKVNIEETPEFAAKLDRSIDFLLNIPQRGE